MKDLIELGRAFVDAMQGRRGIVHIDDVYAENAESIEAVVLPNREFRIVNGRDAIKAKRQDWVATHDILKLEANGPYVHPPNRFAVLFEAEVVQKATGRKLDLREIAIYTVEYGKIVREEFFMLPR